MYGDANIYILSPASLVSENLNTGRYSTDNSKCYSYSCLQPIPSYILQVQDRATPSLRIQREESRHTAAHLVELVRKFRDRTSTSLLLAGLPAASVDRILHASSSAEALRSGLLKLWTRRWSAASCFLNYRLYAIVTACARV